MSRCRRRLAMQLWTSKLEELSLLWSLHDRESAPVAVEQFFPFLLPPLDQICCLYSWKRSQISLMWRHREISQVSECDPVGYLAVQMTGYAKQAGKAGGDGKANPPHSGFGFAAVLQRLLSSIIQFGSCTYTVLSLPKRDTDSVFKLNPHLGNSSVKARTWAKNLYTSMSSRLEHLVSFH